MTDSNWIQLASECGSVPDGNILRKEHVSDKTSVWCNPCISDAWDLVVERKDLSVPWKILLISNIIAKS